MKTLPGCRIFICKSYYDTFTIMRDMCDVKWPHMRIYDIPFQIRQIITRLRIGKRNTCMPCPVSPGAVSALPNIIKIIIMQHCSAGQFCLAHGNVQQPGQPVCSLRYKHTVLIGIAGSMLWILLHLPDSGITLHFI